MAALFPNTAEGLIAFYNFMFADRGFKMPAHLIPVAHALMDPRIDKLLVTIGPGSGKSTLISTVAPAFRLGHDPALTQIGLSAGEGLIQGFLSGVMEWIADSARWNKAFPDVRPNKSLRWSTTRGMFVTGHRPGDPDASYAAYGIDSKKLTGVHARHITMDDIHDKDNAGSSEACGKIRQIYHSTILGRADPQGCRFVAAGRRWHQDDLYGFLADTGEWVHMNLPALREGSKRLWWDIKMPLGFECCFTNY